MESKDVTLYYFPSSYYSLKVLLALFEKGIPFKHVIVDIHGGEQNTEGFLAKNPNGEVPLLGLNGEYISESEVIIDVLDHTFTSGPQLVPDMESSLGQEVRSFRQMLDEIQVPAISFGVLANPTLQVEKPLMLSIFQFSRDFIKKHMDRAYEDLLEKRKKCSPEHRPSFDRKIDMNRRRAEAFLSEYEVSSHLQKLESVFDRIEQRLQNSRQDNQETWLFGTDLTAADITATILMFRLTMIGVAPRYFSDVTRPVVYNYYTRLMKRPSVKRVVDISNSVKQFLFTKKLKSAGKTALKAGLVIGLVMVGYYGFKEFSKKGLAKA